MTFFAFGNMNHDVVVLLHGGGLSWWNYREVAIHLANKYHVILPILDGHADSDTSFTTIPEQYVQIILTLIS